MKKVIALILAVTLGLLLVPSAVTAASGVTVVERTGDGTWIDDTWQVEIYSGESKSTVITLYNSSRSSLDIEITLPDPLDNGNLTFELDKANFTIPGRSYTDVTLTIKASSSATPGTYTSEILEIKSEVAPKDRVTSAPTPPVLEPTPEEPTEPEQPELVEPEPEEPEVVEPEEPTLPEEEEPEVIEPEEEEPEVVEPEEKEEPYVPPAPGTPWGLIGGVVGGLAAAGGIGYWLWLWRRRRKEANYGDNHELGK